MEPATHQQVAHFSIEKGLLRDCFVSVARDCIDCKTMQRIWIKMGKVKFKYQFEKE